MSRKLPIFLGSLIILASIAYMFKDSLFTKNTNIILTNTSNLNTEIQEDTPTNLQKIISKTLITDMSIGSDNAPVTLIEYASFTCTHCRDFHENVFPELKEKFIDTGKVKFIFREVYFDRPGLWAGLLARCGGKEKYFGLTKMLMQGQDKWTKGENSAEITENLYKIGRIGGMTNQQMEACFQDKKQAEAMVEAFQVNSEKHGIKSTPSLVINGTTFNNMSFENLSEKLIAAGAK